MSRRLLVLGAGWGFELCGRLVSEENRLTVDEERVVLKYQRIYQFTR